VRAPPAAPPPLPYTPPLRAPLVIGVRGKGDTPESSDGIVPYWSSSLGPVESEKIVPAGHSVQDSPECAEEVKRILRLHLSEAGRPTP